MNRHDFNFLHLLKRGLFKRYRVSPSETDGTGKLKIGGIFNWLQDSMDEYSTVLGVGADYCRKHNLSYALRGYDVSISSLPPWGSVVPIHTRIECLTPCSFVLRQTMYDPSLKKKLLSACSQVVLLDTALGRLAHPADSFPNYIMDEIISGPYHLPSIPTPQRIDSSYEIIVPWDYIDLNQHVNNARYVELAARGLTPEKLKEMKLRRIAAAFKNAAKCGDHLEIQTQEDPTSSVHSIISKEGDNKTCAKVCFEWDSKTGNQEIKKEYLNKVSLTMPYNIFMDVDKHKNKVYNPPQKRRSESEHVSY